MWSIAKKRSPRRLVRMPPGPAYNFLCVLSSTASILTHAARIRAKQSGIITSKRRLQKLDEQVVKNNRILASTFVDSDTERDVDLHNVEENKICPSDPSDKVQYNTSLLNKYELDVTKAQEASATLHGTP